MGQLTWKPFAAMFVGLFAVCTAAIFIRLAQESNAPSLVVAAGRLTIASLVLLPWAWRRHATDIRQMTRTTWALVLLAGLVLGLHFAAWITSLEYTSVVNSVALVTTNPLWVALMAPFFLGESLRRQTLVGLGLAFAGGLLVAFSDASGTAPTGNQPLLGNFLAIIGAIAAAGYFIIGRRLRGHLAVVPYITVVYTTGAITLLAAALVAGDFGNVADLPLEAWVWIALLGLIPQLIGHTSFNYALGFLSAGYVSLVVLGEPIGSGFLALIFLGETPVALQLMGAALILSGIFIATREQMQQVAPQTATTV